MKTRKIYPGEVHHVCQQTIGGVLVFYTVSDYLVFFTIFCTVAKRYGVKVLALCPMVDHLHNAVVVPSSEITLPHFVQQYTSIFSREWNNSRGRKGPLFKHRYKSSVKLGNKSIKTTLNYNNNNPVERKMVLYAEDYRWNFLKYADKSTPFSAPFDISRKSQTFRDTLKEVKRIYYGGGHLNYQRLEYWKNKLSPIEMNQLADYAINLWNVIDYKEATSYYGGMDVMIRSCRDNTGYDYEIKEDRDNYSDAVYKDCTNILLKEKLITNLFEIPSLPLSRKKALAEVLSNRTTARNKQIKKYLHII